MNKNKLLQSTQAVALCMVTVLTGCIAPAPHYTVVRGPPVYMSPPPPVAVAFSSPVVAPVISVYVDPPMAQPEPIAVRWAPPAMLVEVPPFSPSPMAVWTGGYWDWHDRWVWSAGRWMAPPQIGYGWVQPYYEHRDDAVVFISGHWSAPGLRFVPPPLGISIALAVIAVGVVAGPLPIGPQGVFVPSPPGSRPGLIVPAPVGTPPAVVTSAPPVTHIGMSIRNTTINNISNTTNVTNIANTRNYTVTAPATSTASGKPFEAAVPAAAHLAAALPPVMHLAAPVPVSTKPVAAFVASQAPVPLLPAQLVRPAPVSGVPSAPSAVSLQRPEAEHRQEVASSASSPEATHVARASEVRIDSAKQINVQPINPQRSSQRAAGQLLRPAPTDRSPPPGFLAHAQPAPERLEQHSPPHRKQAVRPSPAGHSTERSKLEHGKE